jgi:hypothetical protein
MSTIYWNGHSGNWTHSIWQGGSAPGPGDTVDIDSGSGGTITLTSSVTVGSLNFGAASDATLDIGAQGTLSVGGITMKGADTLTVAGTINADRELTVGTASVLAMAGGLMDTTTSIALDAGGVVTGSGTITVGTSITGTGSIEAGSAGGGTLLLNVPSYIAANIAVSILGDSTLEFSGAADSTSLRSAGGIDIGTGTLLLANGAVLTLDAAEDTTGGKILLQGGELIDNQGITLGGSLVGAGTVLAGTNTSGLFSGGAVTAKVETVDGATHSSLTFVNAVDQSGAATSFTIDAGAELIFDKGVGTSGGGSNDGTITFAEHGQPGDITGSGTLDISGTADTFYDTVANFYDGDEIIVKDPGNANETLTLLGSKVLEVTQGGTIEAILTFTSEAQALSALDATTGATGDQTSGTFKGGVITTNAICFLAGTMIRTPDGEAAVETLKRGDRVLTADGRAMPVSWLGIQTISRRFADPLRTLPIRISAGALGENTPARDLLLSPDHAILVDGALIHAGALVNGTSITRETDMPAVFTYYHVEVDDHALILAENTPAESFIDNVDRLNFDNWAEHQALYPNGKEISELPYPRAKSHRQVPVNIRVMLAERALATGSERVAA